MHMSMRLLKQCVCLLPSQKAGSAGFCDIKLSLIADCVVMSLLFKADVQCPDADSASF